MADCDLSLTVIYPGEPTEELLGEIFAAVANYRL